MISARDIIDMHMPGRDPRLDAAIAQTFGKPAPSPSQSKGK